MTNTNVHKKFSFRLSPNRRALVLAAGLALGTVLPLGTAWAQANSRAVPAVEWNKVLEAARKEGKVVVYATMAPAVHERIVAAFNAANPGIKMELVRVVGSALTTKIEQERAANIEGADMMLTADIRYAIDATKKGYLKTPLGPNAAAWPDAFVKNGQLVFLGFNPWIFNYNTNLVKTPITSYQDLLRPELANKVGSMALVAEVGTIWYKWLDDTYPGYLEGMAKQNVKMYPSSVAATAATGSGEIAANMFSVIPIDAALQAQNAPVKTVIPNPVYGFSYGGAVLNWARNPNAALVALDFLMSVKGQTAIVGNQEAASPLSGVPGALDTSKMNIQMLDWEKQTPESVKAFEAKWNKLFGAR